MTNSVEKAFFVDFTFGRLLLGFLFRCSMAAKALLKGQAAVGWRVRHAAEEFGLRVFGVRHVDPDAGAQRLASVRASNAGRARSSSSLLAVAPMSDGDRAASVRLL